MTTTRLTSTRASFNLNRADGATSQRHADNFFAEKQRLGFALEVDGRLKTEFSTRDGAEQGVLELKRRFPMLQIRVYDAAKQTRHEVLA